MRCIIAASCGWRAATRGRACMRRASRIREPARGRGDPGDARIDTLVDLIVSKYAPLPARSLTQLLRFLSGGIPQWSKHRAASLERAKRRLASTRIDGIDWYWPAAEAPASRRWRVEPAGQAPHAFRSGGLGPAPLRALLGLAVSLRGVYARGETQARLLRTAASLGRARDRLGQSHLCGGLARELLRLPRRRAAARGRLSHGPRGGARAHAHFLEPLPPTNPARYGIGRYPGARSPTGGNSRRRRASSRAPCRRDPRNPPAVRRTSIARPSMCRLWLATPARALVQHGVGLRRAIARDHAEGGLDAGCSARPRKGYRAAGDRSDAGRRCGSRARPLRPGRARPARTDRRAGSTTSRTSGVCRFLSVRRLAPAAEPVSAAGARERRGIKPNAAVAPASAPPVTSSRRRLKVLGRGLTAHGSRRPVADAAAAVERQHRGARKEIEFRGRGPGIGAHHAADHEIAQLELGQIDVLADDIDAVAGRAGEHRRIGRAVGAPAPRSDMSRDRTSGRCSCRTGRRPGSTTSGRRAARGPSRRPPPRRTARRCSGPARR